MAKQLSPVEFREAACRARADLLTVLTLIHAAFDLHESKGCPADVETCTSVDSRIDSLLILARDRAAEAIDTLDF